MASFMRDENELSFTNRASDLHTPARGDTSTDDFVIKQPVDICDLTASPLLTPLAESRASSSPINSGPSDEDIRKMNEESERLAWELMQQESIDAYNFQVEFMRENSAAMDPADLEALEMAMAEERRAIAAPEEQEQGEDMEEEDSEDWTYDRLLALGEEVGDVKTERWRLRAAAVISSLELHKFGSEELAQCSKHAAHDTNCVVCMEDYEQAEEVRLLPCQHFFHTNCADKWLENKNTCPSCKVKITHSP